MTGIQRRIAFGFQRLRIMKFRLLSDCKRVYGRPDVRQPVQLVGKGSIKFNGKVTLGWFPSPYFFNGSIYIEARGESSVITIEDGVCISNNSFLISDGAGISIGKDTMLGTHCEIIDSDFHDLHPERRKTGAGKAAQVIIGENVLIGSNVKILKGVRIGNNTVIANGAVVTRSIPENSVAFGNPARGGLGLAPDSMIQLQPGVSA
ncbi:MAG TPA: DapH/DapD/GlmU-related protein [Verrucomicrobiae bacterium]|jgi:acetyltransferase-like isoleucine patch superfamily enzyme|nr:DapH/DapD/GlmU-related protein [Verrucomicrobiae bacterium]